MSFEEAIVESAHEIAYKVLVNAFDFNHRHRRFFLRIVHNVLAIARSRGYPFGEQCIAYFKHQEQHTARSSQKMLDQLFEYISGAEFRQLVKASQLSK